MDQLTLFNITRQQSRPQEIKTFYHRFAVVDMTVANVVWGVGETRAKALQEAARYVIDNTLPDYNSIKTGADFNEALACGRFKVFKCSRDFLYFVRTYGGEVNIALHGDQLLHKP